MKKPYVIIAIFIIASFSIGAYLGYNLNKEETKKEIKKYEDILAILKNKVEKLEKENESNYILDSELIDYNNSQKIVPPFILKEAEKNTSIDLKTKPKLVIIIDDISFKYQTDLLKQIPFKVTPSFLPPTKRHENTSSLAKEFSHYMIHLPLEAKNFTHPEPNTLDIKDNFDFIDKRIKKLKKLFPKAQFINNHTGSTFTSNLDAMKKLFKALKENNLGFVDSITTPYTKSKLVEKIYHIPFYKRNIFLDNQKNIKYIQTQLLKAVNIAKKRGYAIAIGHPHKITLLTLKHSKNLLKNVEVVYIDELNKSR